jgi:hypothetical protein
MKLSLSVHRELLNTIIEFIMTEFANYGTYLRKAFFDYAAQYSISWQLLLSPFVVAHESQPADSKVKFQLRSCSTNEVIT